MVNIRKEIESFENPCILTRLDNVFIVVPISIHPTEFRIHLEYEGLDITIFNDEDNDDIVILDQSAIKDLTMDEIEDYYKVCMEMHIPQCEDQWSCPPDLICINGDYIEQSIPW